MAKIKLTYFNLRGRAELARLIMAQACADYEDARIEREQWPELKKTMTFGQMPALEVDGKTITQSIAIARYLAKRFNLAGKDDWIAAEADMVVDALSDITAQLVPAFREQDEAKKAEMMAKFKNETLPPMLANIEKLLVTRGGEWFAGNELTWADLAVANMMEMFQDRFGDALKDCPKIKAHSDKVLALPNIKKWLDTRPKTSM